MSQIFNFARTPDLIFGEGSAKKLPEKIARYGDYFLLVTGSSSFAKSAYGQEILKLISEKGLTYSTIDVGSEPTAELIDGVCKFYKHINYTAVVSIGGGSAIDTGKAISAMLTTKESIEVFLEGNENFRQHSGNKIPFIALPTTAGTGSEATKNAVISKIGEKGYKRSLRHDNFVPHMAIIDPLLQLSCPAEITAASGLDAFTQLLEAYISTQSTVLTDTLALKGIQLIVKSLEKAYLDGSDMEARSDMAMAAYLSGLCLANAGLGTVHGFASSVGGCFEIPHGVICGTLLGAVNRMNIEKLIESKNPAIEKYTQVGKLFLADKEKPDSFYPLSFADNVEQLIEKLKIPRLGAYGVTEKDIEKIVEKTNNKYNPIALTKHDLAKILKARI
jgi:alcohol dehydrogenase class IV